MDKDYDEQYKNRSTAKKHSTKAYSQDHINELSLLIKKYYEVEHPTELINTNPAYFVRLADAINETQFQGREIIKPKYLSEIFTGSGNSKKKNIVKMTSIQQFLNKWLGLFKSKKDELTESPNGTLNDWDAKPNNSTPQWADYVAIPLRNRMLKRFTCEVHTKSKYYRIGLKLLRTDGKLFGDGSIQSLDNNFVIHTGKNFLDKDLFITTYRNGILERPDKYTNIIPKNSHYKFDLYIDNESQLHFFINEEEVYKNLVNKEICNRMYLLAWADGNNFNLKVKNIKIDLTGA